MPNVLITTSSFADDEPNLLTLIENSGLQPVLNPFKRRLTEAEVSQLIAEYQPVGMIAGLEPLTEKVLSAAQGLRGISRCGIGMDNVDLDAAKRLGIHVTNTPDGPSLAVAELAVGLMMAVLRKIPAIDASVRSGKWDRPMGALLSQKTVGIIGCGRIGSYVARLLAGFDCKLLGFDPFLTAHPVIDMVDLDTLLAQSDIVTLHVPLSEQTRQIINGSNIPAMKKGAVVINTARGEVVDEEALYEFLESGHLGGAGIDCFSNEPYQGNLAQCGRAVLTSHVGSYAAEARVRMEREAVCNLLDILQK